MKTRNIFQILLAVMTIGCVSFVSYAQAPTPTRVWKGESNNAGDSNGYWLDPTGDNVYRLAGTITVSQNLTLVVRNREVSIRIKGDNSAGPVFDVQEGGNLRIYGNANYRVIVNGGVTFSNVESPGTHQKYIQEVTGRGFSPSKQNTGPLIQCAGGLILDYVTLTNNYNNKSGDGDGAFTKDGGALHLYAPNENTGKITLTDVIITKCHSENSGGAIHVHGKFSKKIDMINCEISACSTRNGSDVQSGGIIRTNGGTNATLIMNNCTVHNNYTHNVGGVMWWNAYGNAGGELGGSATITGNCRFYNNKAFNDGGAIFNAGADLVVQSCEIFQNEAIKGVGGGIYCRNYVLTGNGQGHLTLGADCYIHDNVAPSGGGVALGLEEVDASKYTVKSLTMTLNINGAQIYNNTANFGAGVYMFKPKDLPADVADKYQNYFYLNGGNIYSNTAVNQGGGVYISGGVAVNQMNSGKIYSNTANQGGGMFVNGGYSEVLGGEFYGNKAITGNGGCFYVYDGSIGITGGSVYQNNAVGNGGGIYVSGGTVTFSNGLVNSNNSNNGAGVFVTGGNVVFNNGTVSNNTASAYGGGIYATGSSGSMVFNGGNVTSNNAVSGAGIFKDGAMALTISGTDEGSSVIQSNIASQYGGGIFSRGSGTMEINKGVIKSNSAGINGGGFYAQGTGNVTMSGGKIQSNTAQNGAGAIIELTSGSFTFSGGEVLTNTAAVDGGAFYIIGAGSTQISGGTISGNTATAGNGGGLNITSTGSVTFSGTNHVIGNTANNGIGGGLYVNSSAQITFNDGSFMENKAKNGGGIALINGAKLSFYAGDIINNKADGSATGIKTGYQKNPTDIAGFGGGIFLANGQSGNETLFQIGNDLARVAIYNNNAATAASDIFANAVYTKFIAPDPHGKKLVNGFISDGWYEDYVNNDEKYSEGTKVNTAASPLVERYETAVTQNHPVFDASDLLTGGFSKYTCLRLAYGPVDISISKAGLMAGESASFKVYQKDYPDRIYNILITGVDNEGTAVSQVISYIPLSETMTVEESLWSWAYDVESGLDENRGKTQNIATESPAGSGIYPGRKFEFTNTAKTSEIPLHSEAIKENNITY